jgi:hypothetical protein
MQRLEVSGAVRHIYIYIYIYVVRRQRVNASFSTFGIGRKMTGILSLYANRKSRSQWSRGLRRRSTAARLLRSWVRIPAGHGCLSVVCYQIEVLRPADHSSRGVLPTAARRCM